MHSAWRFVFLFRTASSAFRDSAMSIRLPDIDRVWFLTGPTASGKSAIGLELARLLGAEVISLDSMALYRGMDIGTAKPNTAERQAVPHHLIDVIEPHEEYSVAQYVTEATRVVAEILSRGRVPLFVGGTPLYLKSLLRGIFPGPPADWTLRDRLAAEEVAEPGVLHGQLAAIDPIAAARLSRNDTRRIIRALEVFEKTGATISSVQQQFDVARTAEECRVFALDRPRDELNARIDERVEAMFAAGLVDEVRGLAAGGSLSRTASQAVGYREVLEHLAGGLSLADTIALVKVRTRQFAKRQMTWFRSLSECRRIEMDGVGNPAEVAEKLLKLGQATGV